MDEATLELVQKAESLTPQDKINQKLDCELGRWISTTFKKEMSDLVRIPHHDRAPDWYKRMAQAQYDLTRVLYAYQANASSSDFKTIQAWNVNVTRRLFGDPPNFSNSVVGSRRDKKQQQEIIDSIIGSVSGVKMLNYITTVRTDLKGKLPIRQMFDAQADTIHAVDYTFEFGDTNPNTKEEIIRLVQLKTISRKESPCVFWIDPDADPPDEVLKGVSKEDIDHMTTFAAEMSKGTGLDVRSYVIFMPTYSLPSEDDDYQSPNRLDSVFGLETTTWNLEEKLGNFAYSCKRSSFLP
jgi:hypothetical protein